MKNRKWLALLLAGSLALTVGLTGCGKGGDKTGSKADAEQYLNTVMFEQRTLDINDAEDADSAEILTETMEGLTRVYSDGNKDIIKPAIAEDWKVSDDGLTYTFKLRDAKWSDGKAVTAQQFVDSWLRLLNPEKAFGYAYFAYDVKNAQKYNAGEAKAEDVGVKAVDDKTFEVTLERPSPSFIKKVGFKNLFPIRLDIVEAEGETYGSDFTKMVWNGPFKITEYITNNKTVLEKNAEYWDAANVKLAKITMQTISEVATQMQMFESKQLDITGASRDYLKKYAERAKNGEFTHMSGTIASTYYFAFNNKTGGPSGLFLSPKIRQAFSLIIDREDVTKNVYGRYLPALGWNPPRITIGDKEYRKEVKEPMVDLKAKYDTEEKVAALFKEGLQELGKDPNGTYKVAMLTSGTDAVSKSTQEYYQNTFKKLPGVEVTLTVAADSNQYWDMIDAMEFDITMPGWYGDYDDPMTFFDVMVTNGGNNIPKYSSKDYDNIINEVTNEADNAKRIGMFEKAEILLINDMPLAPVFYMDTNRFQHNYVKNTMYPLFGATYELKEAYTEGR